MQAVRNIVIVLYNTCKYSKANIFFDLILRRGLSLAKT